MLDDLTITRGDQGGGGADDPAAACMEFLASRGGRRRGDPGEAPIKTQTT